MLEIRRLVVQLATEHPTWGYTRIQGALEHLNHRVARSTIAKGCREQGLPPGPERPTSWQTVLRAHWEHLVGADVFTTEGWTVRGVVPYDTLFVIELASRRVRIVGATPHQEATTRGPAQLLLPSDVMGAAEFSNTTHLLVPGAGAARCLQRATRDDALRWLDRILRTVSWPRTQLEPSFTLPRRCLKTFQTRARTGRRICDGKSPA